MSALIEEIESRSYPRVAFTQTVKLTNESGARLHANLGDISPDGLQATCALDDALSLFAKNAQDGGVSEVRIMAEFYVPNDSGNALISAECRLIHSAPSDNNGVTFGLKFVQLKGDSRTQLGKFLVAAMEHA